MKHLKKFEAKKILGPMRNARDYIEEKSMADIKDIFTDVSDEGISVGVLVHSRDSRTGGVMYEIKFNHNIKCVGLDDAKQAYSVINKLSNYAFDALTRLESMGYKTAWKNIITTTHNDFCSIDVKMQVWSK